MLQVLRGAWWHSSALRSSTQATRSQSLAGVYGHAGDMLQAQQKNSKPLFRSSGRERAYRRRALGSTEESGALVSFKWACRGIGRQAQLAAFNLAGFWGTGVPVGYFLCFHMGWGLRGLWTGILAGVCVTRCVDYDAGWLRIRGSECLSF